MPSFPLQEEGRIRKDSLRSIPRVGHHLFRVIVMVHVSIKREDCTACSTCWETCPEVFEENGDDSFSQIREKYRAGGSISEGEVPDSLKGCVGEAAALCPVRIISVTEE